MKRIKRYYRVPLKMVKGSTSGIREFICFFFLAIMLICLLKGKVNSFVISLLPEDEVKITVKDSDNSFKDGARIRIIKEGNRYELFEKCKKAAEKDKWKYEKREESWTSLTNKIPESVLSFKAKRLPNTYIAIYCILFSIILSILLSINYFFKNKEVYLPNYLNRKARTVDVVWVWGILYFIALVLYKIVGIPQYLNFGDQKYYWDILLLNNGKIDMQYLAEKLFSSRGYWCHVFQTIAVYAGSIFDIDSVCIWLLFPSCFFAVLAVVIFPGYLKILNNKSAKIVEVLAFTAIFVYYWLGYLTGVVMDLPGAVTLFASILCMIYFYKEQKAAWAVLAGGCGAMSAGFRTANMYGIYAFLIIAVICKVWKNRDKGFRLFIDKKFAMGILAGIAAFLIVCIPQFAINYEKGHVGFLPYDFEEAWFGRSLVESSADSSLSWGEMVTPMSGITDKQMITMKSALYNIEAPLGMAQIFDVFAESPLETFMFILKKILIGFDVQTNVLYPLNNEVNWRDSSGMIFSFVNYFILFTGMYMLFFSKKVNKKERLVSLLLFLSIVLPETFVHMEWRYIIAGYAFLYYMFAFYFIGDTVLVPGGYKKLIEESNYLPFMLITIFIMFCFSFSVISFRFA